MLIKTEFSTRLFCLQVTSWAIDLESYITLNSMCQNVLDFLSSCLLLLSPIFNLALSSRCCQCSAHSPWVLPVWCPWAQDFHLSARAHLCLRTSLVAPLCLHSLQAARALYICPQSRHQWSDRPLAAQTQRASLDFSFSSPLHLGSRNIKIQIQRLSE